MPAAKTLSAFALAYGVASVVVRLRLQTAVNNAIWDHCPAFLQPDVERVFWSVSRHLGSAYGMALFAATILLPLGIVGRMVARAHTRAGHVDPLDRVRDFARVHPKVTGALLCLPGVLWSMLFLRWYRGTALELLPRFVLPALISGYGHLALARFGLRALLAPTLSEAESEPVDVTKDEIRFNAVAVTRETRAAVGVVAALSVVMAAAALVLPIGTLMHDARFFAAVSGYVAVVLAGTAFFRKASRIAIGLDGVLVYGTSRTRFFAYRDLDGARTRSGDLEILRGSKVVLRLQLHGHDATRRDAVLERLKASLTRANDEQNDATTGYVASASSLDLVRAAQGAGDYRRAAVSREQLWAVVEGPAIDSASRKAAAEALAHSCDEGERARLRVAAEHCAEPMVRIALHQLAELAEAIDDDEAGSTPAQLRAAPRAASSGR